MTNTAQSLTMSLRVQPLDAMSCVDVCSVSGITTSNLSIAMVTKLALAILLESQRQAGNIPRRDGFEFSTMMEPFTKPNISSRAAKLKHANVLSQPKAIPDLLEQIEPYERKQRRVQYEELMFKRNEDPDNFTEGEMDQLLPLIKEFS